MARLEPLFIRKCKKCGLPAAVEVLDRANVSHGYYCLGHGKRKLDGLKANEVQADLDRIAASPTLRKEN